MTVGSLFAGIGGFDLGLERAGMTVKWQVEIDPFCRQVLAKHWPAVQRYDDVRTVGAHNLEPVDLICGGFPCQDISTANPDGAGLAGARSGLWAEYARLIRELRPRYVVVENVAALLGRGMGRVVGDLAALGYDAEWDCLPAAAIGAPHYRDRIWIVAYPGCGTVESVRAGGVSADPASGAEGQASQRERFRPTTSHGVADANGRDEHRWRGPLQMGRESLAREAARHGIGPGAQWGAEPDVGRVAHGVPARVDRLRGLGNAIVPQIAEWLGRRILEADGGHA